MLTKRTAQISGLVLLLGFAASCATSMLRTNHENLTGQPQHRLVKNREVNGYVKAENIGAHVGSYVLLNGDNLPYSSVRAKCGQAPDQLVFVTVYGSLEKAGEAAESLQERGMGQYRVVLVDETVIFDHIKPRVYACL